MLVVIFGAGASYDSYSAHPPDQEYPPDGHPNFHLRESRPPLAGELFDLRYGDIIANRGPVRGMVPRLRRAPHLEEELERMVEESTGILGAAREMIALRYYIRDVIRRADENWWEYTSGVTNYAELLRGLRIWQAKSQELVSLVTFNYDSLLDSACYDEFGLSLGNMASYISDAKLRLFKPHGSISWLRSALGLLRVDHSDGFSSGSRGATEIDLAEYESGVYPLALDNAEELHWSDDYITLEELERSAAFEGGSRSLALGCFLPAISVPVVTKSKFECPPAQLDALYESVPEVDRVLVIGWRAAEEHFLKRWRSQDPRQLRWMHLVTGGKENQEDLIRRLASGGITSNRTTVSESGFSHFVSSGDLQRFLAADEAEAD